jgi:hypothetical protein
MKKAERRKTLLYGFLTTVGLLFLGGVGATSQNVTATISGFVTDSTGSAIPEATVTATNILTNNTISKHSDETGHYEFVDLSVGGYKVSVEKPGFKRYERAGLTLHAGNNYRVDAPMVVGSMTEEVTVNAQAAQVNTISAEVGETITERSIVDLPLNGRDVGQLISLTPGANGYANVNWWGFNTTFVTTGGSWFQNRGTDWLLDGGLFTWTYVNSGAQLPNPDALEEFHYNLNQRSAEYGRDGTSTINTVIKSGSNQFRGRVWEFNRNAGLNARPYLSTGVNPKLVQNQFGGTAGGPIWRSKAFFFGSYEGLRQAGAAFTYSTPVPTALERTGDFSQSAVGPIDPTTGLPYPGDQVPVDPVSANILAWVPTANTGTNTWSGNSPNDANSNQYLGKVDYNLTSSHHLAGSYFDLRNNGVNAQGSNIIATPASITNYVTAGHEQQANLSDVWTISPQKLNTARFVYLSIGSNRGWLQTTDTLATLGSKFTSGADPHPPNLLVNGYFSIDATNDGFLWTHNQEYSDIFRWGIKRHQLSLGGEYLYYHDYQFSSPGPWTKFFGTYTGNALADFITGDVNQFQYGYPDQKSGDQTHGLYAAFAQDNWQVMKKLTLNLGLRWEYLTRVENPTHASVAFSPYKQSVLLPDYLPGWLFRDPFTGKADPGWRDGGGVQLPQRFDPRFGFSYDVFGNGRVAVRGGFGVYSTEVESISFQPGAGPYAVPAPSCAPGTLSLVPISNPYITTCDPITAASGWNGPPAGYSAPVPFYGGGIDPATTRPYNLNFSLGVQYQPTHKTFFEATYVGNQARHLWFNYDYFGGPQYAPGATENNIADRYPYLPGQVAQVWVNGTPDNSRYNGLLVQLNQNMNHGLQFTSSYTWSKAEDANHWPVEDWSLPRGRWGISDGNFAHNLVVSFIYAPQFQISNRVSRALVNGWEVSGIAQFESGGPFTVLTGTDNLVNGYYGSRPIQNGDAKLDPHRSRAAAMAEWFNTSVFSDPGIGFHGNIGVDTLEAPGLKNLDASLMRTFPIHERAQFQFHFDAFNAFNLVNLGYPDSTFHDPLFGAITYAGSMRQLQFGGKIMF